MPNTNSTKDFVVRVPASFLKDAAISTDAKVLRAVLGAFADGRSGRTYVKPCTLGELLGWGRSRREAAQRELVRTGWLQLGWKRGREARWARRIYILAQPPVARFARSGRNEQLIIDHKHGVQIHRAQPVSMGQLQSGQVISDHGPDADFSGLT